MRTPHVERHSNAPHYRMSAAKDSWAKTLVVAAVAFVATMSALRHPFSTHDDPQEILNNPSFQPLEGAALKRMWSEVDFSFVYMPVNYTALGLVTMLSGHGEGEGIQDPRLFHLVSILVHIVNALLVYFVLAQLLPRRAWACVAGALVFACHPLQVEAYARAGNLGALLGGFFSLLAFAVVLSGGGRVRSGRFWVWLGITVLFVLALLSRPSYAVFPLAVAVLLIARRGRVPRWRQVWTVLTVWLLLAGGFVLFTLSKQPDFPASQEAVAWLQRPAVAANALMFYVAKGIVPLGLSIDYGMTPQRLIGGFWMGSVFSLLAISVLIVVGFRRGGSWRVAAAGGLFWLVCLLPGAGLFPNPTRELMSVTYDRYQYLGLLGLAMVVAVLLGSIRREVATAVGAGGVMVLLWVGSAQLATWRDPVSFYRHAIKVNPESWYAHSRLGAVLTRMGNRDLAMRHSSIAHRLHPTMTEPIINLGRIAAEGGDVPMAIKFFAEAIRIDPRLPNAHYNLGIARLSLGDPEGAGASFDAAIRLAPGHLQAYAGLVRARLALDDFRGAVAVTNAALAIVPSSSELLALRARAFSAAGNASRALSDIEMAISIAPRWEWRAERAALLLRVRPEDGELALSSLRAEAEGERNLATKAQMLNMIKGIDGDGADEAGG